MKKLGDDSSARHDPADENQATILVVDDEATIRDLITFMLDALGYKVLSARNAAQALAIANSSEGDCVSLLISDLNLPDMSGIVLAAKLRLGRNRQNPRPEAVDAQPARRDAGRAGGSPGLLRQ